MRGRGLLGASSIGDVAEVSFIPVPEIKVVAAVDRSLTLAKEEAEWDCLRVATEFVVLNRKLEGIDRSAIGSLILGLMIPFLAAEEVDAGVRRLLGREVRIVPVL